VFAHDARPIRWTPYILFGQWSPRASFRCPRRGPFAPAADIIALVGVFALARMFRAAMDIGRAFGGSGARRGADRFLAEPAMLMTLLTAAFISGSTGSPPSSILPAHRVRPPPSLASWRSPLSWCARENAHPDRQPGYAPGAHRGHGADPRVPARLALIDGRSPSLRL
jgi:hypothetical protein